ncbi:MAG: amino acid adenylation domain-containing protein [Pseudohongiellaceae bacterium]|jgi:amino acid adenylation domain-containing protein/non-ribosomal peptide synthase protein (TIGR01720 family)
MSTTGFTLSPQQNSLWNQLHQGDGRGLSALAVVSLSGELDGEHLSGALQLVVDKYEILRTHFVVAGDGLLAEQQIRETAKVDLLLQDGSDLDRAGQDRVVAQWVAELHNESLAGGPDVGCAATLRGWLLRRSQTEHELLLALPALCADELGLVNLVGELARAYDSLGGGEAYDTEAMQYADIGDWQIELLEAEESQPGLSYWAERTAGGSAAAGASLEIPFQHGAAGRRGVATASVVVRVESAVAAKLQALSTQLRVTPREVLLGAWASILRRLGGQNELLLGLSLSGRQYEELSDPLGLLARTLPLPLELDLAESFADLVSRLGLETEAMERWQECYGAELGGDHSRVPDIRAPGFAFESGVSRPRFSGAAVSFSIAQQFAASEPCACRLVCRPENDGFIAEFRYDPASFEPGTMQRLAGQWQALLSDACDRPETPVGLLQALSATERQSLLIDFNDTDAPYSRGICAHNWIEEWAEKTPDAVAVRQGEQTLTYGQLEVRANQLGHHLRSLGVGPDTMVALCIDRSLDMVVAIVGILKAGGAYVPVDPAYPKDRIQFLVSDTNAPVLVTQERLLADFEDTGAQLVALDKDRALLDGLPETRPESGVTPANLVYVIYTSGSTGKPKGVVITHEKLVISNEARVHAFGHTPSSFLLLSSVAFDSSVVGIFWSLCGGGSLLLMPQGLEKDIAEIPKYIAAHGASHLLTLPSFYRHILEQSSAEQLASLSCAIVAGEACPLKMVEHHRTMLPEVGLFSEYGATETTVFSSVYDCLSQTEPIAPLGDPILNIQKYILDEHLGPCPTGVAGEVHFGGIALALGYWRRPELTAERFVPNPFGTRPGTRLYKSGDRARFRENGEMEFLGRYDNQVKIRGFRIELEEIEVALVEHGTLKEAAVLARSDHGEEKRLVAYLLVEEGTHAPSVSELRDFLAESLPEFMVPAVFLFMPSMPRTPNGKVDRKALPEPGADRPELESDFEAPQSEAEKSLAGIWADVLGIDAVGVHDNFFELGGDSILSIQVVSRANQAGIKLTPRLVFEYQTVAELLEVAEVSATPMAREDQGPVIGPVLLTPVQHWYFELGLPRPEYWNMPMLLEVARPLDQATLVEAMTALELHHDALRSRFVCDAEGHWSQRNAAPAPSAAVIVEDLSALPPEDHDAELDRRAAVHHGAFDLDAGPVQQLVLFERGEGLPPKLLWNVHHLLIDGVSWRILLEDLETALDQLEAGEAVQLQAKTTSFQRWSSCLTEYAQTAELAAEVGHWLTLDEADALQAAAVVPLDRASADNVEGSAAQVRMTLDKEKTKALLSEVPKTYNTQINDVLLTALSRAFSQWTGHEKLWLVLEGHGRQEIPAEVDLSRTVGWFTSDYPVLLTQTTGSYQPGPTLQAIKEQLRAIPNQGFGFGLGKHLSDDAALREQLNDLPWPVVGFNYLGQFDQLFKGDARFRYDGGRSGPPLGPDGQRIFVLEIYGMISQGQLELDFEFSENVHDRATIEALASNFSAALEELIAHCLSPDAGGFSASDFSDFSWDAGDLSSIADAISKSQQDKGPQ